MNAIAENNKKKYFKVFMFNFFSDNNFLPTFKILRSIQK